MPADTRAVMYRLQEEYNTRLTACLEDTLLMSETERMQRALHISSYIAQKERKWIEDKGRMALAQDKPTTFNKELNFQLLVHEQRLKAIRSIFVRRRQGGLNPHTPRTGAEERQWEFETGHREAMEELSGLIRSQIFRR